IAIQDNNGDGLIEQLVIDFSENIDTNDSAPPVLADFGTITLPDGSTVSSATITDPAGSTAFITLTNVVGQVTPNTGAGSTGIDGITNEWTDGVNLTSNPDDGEGIIDDAKPILRTDGSSGPTYEDSNTDGTIDRVKLVFTEASTITYSDGDWTVNANGLTSLDVSGISSGNGTSTVYLTASAQSYLTGVGGLSEPNIAFTPSSGSISDGTNTLLNISTTDLTDSAAPALRTDGSNEPVYLDNDSNGTIDRVRLTFTENATVTYSDGDWVAVANDLTSFDVGAYLSGNGSTQILLTGSAASNLTGVSGGTEPTLRFTASSGSIVDAGGASLSSFSAASLVDESNPVATAYVYKDVDGNGTVDRMDITFTETITVNECELGDYSLTGSDSSGLSYSACGTNSADLQLTITGAPANDTNLALEFAYNAANGTSNSLDDTDSNDVATISTQTATDGARPVLVSFAYSDEDADAQIDRVTAGFSETVTLDSYVDVDWSATANDLTGFDVTGYNSGNGTANIALDATADPGQTGVSGGTEPTLGFTPTSSDVNDGTNNTFTIPGTSVEDNAVMGVLTSAYKDINTDGAIDRLDVTFSEMPTVGECEAGDYSFGGADAGSLAVSACAVSGSDLRLTMSNGPSNDTDLTFTWSYDASTGTASSLEDGNATAAPDYNSVSPTDAAVPLRVSQQYTDANSDGTVDRFDITFTENIAFDECEVGDFTIGGADAGGLSIVSCATSGDDLRLNVSGGTANDTFYTLTLAYTAANGTVNSLDDTSGNPVGNLSGASLTDGADPIAITVQYSDINGDGQVDQFNLTFTENITLDECETEDWVIGGADAGGIAVVDTTGCSASGADIDFTLINTPANDTSLTITFSYVDNGTSGSLHDQGAAILGPLVFSALTDNAAPTLVSRTYLDINSNGQIDRLDVTYTEPVTVATCESGDHIFAGADAGSLAVSACETSGSDVRYTLTGGASNDTNIAITYEYDKDASTANSLVDGSSNVIADAAATSVLDGAAPVLRTDGANAPQYLDTDFDGQVDGAILTFTESTTITYSDGDWTTTVNDLTGLDVSGVSSGNGTSSITFTASATAGLTGVDAGTEPTIAYTNTAGSIVDGSANERTSFIAATFEDGAAPAAVSQNYKDINNDGQVDRVDVTFSEFIEQNECESADFSFGGTDTGAIAVASCAISTNELRLTISNAPAQDTNLDLTWSYDASNGTANSLDDSDGNGTGDQAAVTLADAAAPLLISSTPVDSVTSVASDADVVLTFTEPMDTGTLTYTYTNYSSGATVVWSSGNSVATLTPDGTYDSEANITFEITAADDPSANSMVNTISTHPFSFVTVTVETASSGNLYVEKAGQYTSLSIYDAADLTTPLASVVPGQEVSIVWSHNGNITTTEVYYQMEEQQKGSVLIDLVFDGGTQSDWVIPTGLALGQELVVTTVNSQKVSYAASATVVLTENGVVDEEVINEEPVATNGQIRTDSSPGVYSTFADGTRRVFMNSLTYFTWHNDFDAVETVETPVMSDYALTGVMLPKAGTVLVKIQSIPNVYYLEENPDDEYRPILRWIPDEETAIELFGDDWALSVVDIEPTFFTKFVTSDDPLSMSDVSWIETDVLRTREDLAL
ncbi:MAG: Ig-like domain-containing protein, partial [bacterium]|nr:Ig-like domain-containing protein [bacterium]